MVITGASSGLGAALATHYATSGATVGLIARRLDRLEALAAAHPGKMAVWAADVTDSAAMQIAAKSFTNRFGPPDIVIANAGVSVGTLGDSAGDLPAFRRVMDVNVNGVFYSNRSVVPHMLAGGWGRIVNIASVAGKEGNPNAAAYSTSKAAVIGLTKSLGKELANTPVRVNCVTPAAVRTPIFEQMSQAHIDFMLSKIPMGRFGTVDEVAAMVCWLCSEEASFSTGAVFDCSGGRATY